MPVTDFEMLSSAALPSHLFAWGTIYINLPTFIDDGGRGFKAKGMVALSPIRLRVCYLRLI